MQDYSAKVSDFGLSKDGPVGEKSHVSRRSFTVEISLEVS
jgi:hypothetical protein